MKRILLFCALGALWGCRTVTEPTTEAITLSCSTSESSKVGALTAGDEVAVFARIEGTETYFLEAEKFITGSDGKTLSTTPAVHYPEPKQTVEFFAYFPYHTGSFDVPTDQSTAAALKQADLCWATASSTPVSIVPLTFQHLFARLIVQTNEPTSKIACQVVPSGTLNPATAQFNLNNTKSEISTTGNELILPVQPLSRLVLTVANIEYVFEGSINLQSGQTTTLNLTLNTTTKTATLNGSSTTKWTASNQSGSIEQTASNVLTLHWANYVPQGTTPDKIILTINNTDYTISSGITYADKTFTVPFASSALRYPYTISKITFYSGSTQSLPSCTQLLGATIYKSASQTLGIKDPANVIKIGNLWWTTGNLIANGPNGCRVGTPTDYGLYFQFGSLIGWSGGANGDGTGQGTPWSAIVVSPIGYSGVTSPYSSVGRFTATGSYGAATYFGSQSGGATNPSTGVGDPCSFYIGANWRTPTMVEMRSLFGVPAGSYVLPVGGFSYIASPTPTLHKASAPSFTLPFAGRYDNGTGAAWTETQSYLWTSSVGSATEAYYFAAESVNIHLREYWSYRYMGIPVRCVSE